MIRRRWLLVGLALQNVGRRKARTALLVAAVAISCAVVFAGAVTMRSIGASIAVGFSRMGADMMAVPAEALTNITAALLTVEPTERTMDAAAFAAPVPGVARAAPQRVFRTDQAGFGGAHEPVDLVGFDRERDFTIQPWISERLGRRMQSGDIIAGAARDLPIGSEITLFGRPFRVYARLARTGVGTHERALFMAADDLLTLASPIRERTGQIPPMLERDRVSGFLLQIAPGATERQVRFVLLSRMPGIKLITGESLLISVRGGLQALLIGALALVVLGYSSTIVMVCVLFSAIVAERRSELGLLKAIGTRRRQIAGLMIIEAMLVTSIGGLLGVVVGELLLRLFARSVVYHLSSLGIPFLWTGLTETAAIAAACVGAAAFTGAIGALVPAWRASRRDAYELILAVG